MTTVTYEAFAYMDSSDTLERIVAGKSQPMLSKARSSYFEGEGDPFIGMATVTLTLNSHDQIIQAQIEGLNQKLQDERATSQLRQNAILDQISKLQALTFAEAA